MAYIYPLNNPGGVHLTFFDSTHLSPPPREGEVSSQCKGTPPAAGGGGILLAGGDGRPQAGEGRPQAGDGQRVKLEGRRNRGQRDDRIIVEVLEYLPAEGGMPRSTV